MSNKNTNANCNKFNKELASYYDITRDYERFWLNTKRLNCFKDKRWCYLMAHHAYKAENNVKRAKTYIDYAIKNIESTPEVIAIGDFLNQEKTNIGSTSLYTISNKDIYLLAGEIYAQIDKSRDSDFYKLFQKEIMDITPLGRLRYLDEVVLYTFRTISQYTLADLINKEITVSPIQSMNDPFDCLGLLWAREENLNVTCKEKKHIQPFSKSFDFYRIRSFIANRDTYESDDTIVQNKLMWSHYADKHRGICIKYKLSSHFIKGESDNGSRMYLRPVTYSNEGNLNRTKIKSGIDFCSKSKDWEYEQEVRLVSYDASTNEPWIGIPLDKRSKIEAIYFGYNCNDKEMRLIRNILEGQDVKLYKMSIDANRNIYELVPRGYK